MFIYQGCTLSPTHFAMFIDVLVQDINLAQLRFNCQTCTLSTLLYADDIVLLAPSTENLQGLINVVAEWCINLKMGYEREPGQDQYSTFPKKVKIQA